MLKVVYFHPGKLAFCMQLHAPPSVTTYMQRMNLNDQFGLICLAKVGFPNNPWLCMKTQCMREVVIICKLH